MFCLLSGISRDTLDEWASSGRSDLQKIIHQNDEISLEQMLQDPKLNPMKILPSLNKKHGWALQGVTREYKVSALAENSLPKLSLNDAQLSTDNQE